MFDENLNLDSEDTATYALDKKYNVSRRRINESENEN